MKLLAIDTSTEIASIALMVDGNMRCEDVPSQKTQAQTLLPLIFDLMSEAEISIGQLDAIVFGRGPGSFTGLRIACSIAKGLAYAHNIKLIPVSTLAAIAEDARQLPGNANAPILAVLDARMQELYWDYFPIYTTKILEKVGAADTIVVPDEKTCIVAGVGFEMYEAFSSRPWMQKITIYPKASTMIKLAQTGAFPAVCAGDAEPLYVRNSVTQGAKNG